MKNVKIAENDLAVKNWHIYFQSCSINKYFSNNNSNSRYMNKSGPKVTKSSCDWNIVAEKSWKNVKKLKLIRVGAADLNAIITATKEFCDNIEEIQIDELSYESQLAQDLDKAPRFHRKKGGKICPKKKLQAWVIPNGVIFNPQDPSKVTLKNVTSLKLNPESDSDYSFFDWKDIFSHNLTRLDLYMDGIDDLEDTFNLFYQNVKTFLKKTHLKHFVIESRHYDEYVRIILELIPDTLVTKFELLSNSEYQSTWLHDLDIIGGMTNQNQLTISNSQEVAFSAHWTEGLVNPEVRALKKGY
jgi:hypothetical protein